MHTLRIAQAQINPTVGDINGNLALIEDFLSQARQAQADIVTFPELAITGYPPEDLLMKPRFLQDTAAAMGRLVEKCRGINAVVGYAEYEAGFVFNSAAVISDGSLLGSYRKVALPNYGVFDEERYFTPGSGYMVLELKGVRMMLTICEDLWVPDCMAVRGAFYNQAGITLNISASPFYAGKLNLRRRILMDFAKRSNTYVYYNNLLGGQDELVFDGGSLVMNPDGQTIASARRFAQDLLVVDLALEEANSPPKLRLQDGYLNLTDLRPGPREAISAPCAQELDLTEEVYEALVLGTGDYVRKNGFKKVVLGLSGGVDSSLVAAVAADALGVDNVIGVTMPSPYTSKETRNDAGRLAANLGIKLLSVPIARIFAAYLEDLAEAVGEEPSGVVAENLQARIRGNILMGLSNHFGWLVLTTGNKSETAVGYCTLYGDMAGGFAVIKDVPKTLVYDLVRQVNAKAGREVVPESVIERAPSAELRPDQKDQDSLPPYEVLDPILKAYVEQDKVLDEIAALGFEAAVVKQVVRLVDLNEYKRRQAPPGVKITPKAFGRDRRLPITNHYHPGVE